MQGKIIPSFISMALLLPIILALVGCTGLAPITPSVTIILKADLSQVSTSNQESVLTGSIEILKLRLQAIGVKKPNIQRQGVDEVTIKLPSGVDITDEQVSLLGRNALLEFREQVDVKDAAGKVTGQKWVPATAIINGGDKITEQ